MLSTGMESTSFQSFRAAVSARDHMQNTPEGSEAEPRDAAAVVCATDGLVEAAKDASSGACAPLSWLIVGMLVSDAVAAMGSPLFWPICTSEGSGGSDGGRDADGVLAG
jgi:hypothetical protein